MPVKLDQSPKSVYRKGYEGNIKQKMSRQITNSINNLDEILTNKIMTRKVYAGGKTASRLFSTAIPGTGRKYNNFVGGSMDTPGRLRTGYTKSDHEDLPSVTNLGEHDIVGGNYGDTVDQYEDYQDLENLNVYMN
jgi:hypothetical protein